MACPYLSKFWITDWQAGQKVSRVVPGKRKRMVKEAILNPDRSPLWACDAASAECIGRGTECYSQGWQQDRPCGLSWISHAGKVCHLAALPFSLLAHHPIALRFQGSAARWHTFPDRKSTRLNSS